MATKSKSGGIAELMSALAAKGGAGGLDPKSLDILNGDIKGKIEIERKGDKITLPPGMSFDEAIVWLMREKQSYEAVVAINEQIPCLPLDGAHALYKVLQQHFGFVDLVQTPGFFGPTPPHMVSVATGPETKDTIQIPWGRMQLPGIDGYIETSATISDGRPVFVIGGEIKRLHEEKLHDIADDVRAFVREFSLYRGKAIKVEFHEAGRRDNPFDDKFAPKFLAASHHEVILNDDAQQRLQVELYNPVVYADRCRQFGIPLKRGVLLEGPYGTGKTLTAHSLASTCTEHGWTFIYLENAEALQNAIAFARLYQPCVIFAEDIDKVIEEHDDPELVTIRNALDSVETKNTEMMVVLTTNHIEELPPGFLRCGRIDSVVTIGRPDAGATVKLARLYGKSTIQATDEELTQALMPVVGQSAAVIREVVERAKLSAVEGADNDGNISVRAQDLAVTAMTMKAHTDLLAERKEEPVNPAIAYHTALVEDVARRAADVISSEC